MHVVFNGIGYKILQDGVYHLPVCIDIFVFDAFTTENNVILLRQLVVQLNDILNQSFQAESDRFIFELAPQEPRPFKQVAQDLLDAGRGIVDVLALPHHFFGVFQAGMFQQQL